MQRAFFLLFYLVPTFSFGQYIHYVDHSIVKNEVAVSRPNVAIVMHSKSVEAEIIEPVSLPVAEIKTASAGVPSINTTTLISKPVTKIRTQDFGSSSDCPGRSAALPVLYNY